jgi:hypothetical protein
MKKKTNSIRIRPLSNYKCGLCSLVFLGAHYDKHRSECGQSLTEEKYRSVLTFAPKNKIARSFNNLKRSEVIAEIKKSNINGPYTKKDEMELNRTQGNRYAGFVKK